MQPDPFVFIPAMRRELLSPDLFGKNLAEGLSPIVMSRMAETLAQLTLRYTRLPQMLREQLPSRMALLNRIQERCKDLGSTVEPAVRCARKVAEEAAGQQDIEAYEIWGIAVSACIRTLSERGRESAPMATLLAEVRRAGSELDLELRARYKQELEAVRQEISAPKEASLLPQPTDAELTAVLRAHFPELPSVAARDVRRLPGVTAKETFFFELQNHPQWPELMVLRREPVFNPTRTFVADELELLNRLHREGLPVPRALLADAQGSRLGAGFIVVERLPGTPRLPESWGAAARPLALRVAEILARIHRLNVHELGAPYCANNDSAQAHVLRRLENFYQRWISGRTEPSVTLEAAYSWMRENIGCVGPELSLVHGDCNFRNILLEGDRVSAILDWELAHPGHAAEDLAYIKPDIEKIMSWQEFLDAYLRHGGVPVREPAIKYFHVWANVWRTTLAANCHAGFVSGEHHSYLFGSVGHNEYYNSLDPLCSEITAT